LKKRSLWMSAIAALAAAATLAGCGSTTYFAGRTLPPSGIANRVMVAIQNPSALSKGALQILDAYYDTRYEYSNMSKTYSISGYSGGLPSTIQNLPEQTLGLVYGSSDGSLYKISYAKETSSGAVSGLSGLFSSVFASRDLVYTVGASVQNSIVTVVDQSGTNSGTYTFTLPNAQTVSMNAGGSVALIFAKNSDYMYYLRKLSASETTKYSGGSSTWPAGAADCEPVNSPAWCLMKALDSGTGAALTFDRPSKAVFSNDGGTAYVLSAGPESGGKVASVKAISIAPMIYLSGQHSGTLPTQTALDSTMVKTPGGATNALVNGSVMYVVGQQKMTDGYWGGHLTEVTLPTSGLTGATAGSAISISDGTPGYASRMVLGDDDTLWIAMQKCNQGERANNPGTYGSNYGCLTMFNTSSNTVTAIEPWLGDATGVTAVTTLHKVYAAIGGQVYIYSTTSGDAINNQYVTVTGTAYDVAYMDATSDSDNTVY